MPAKPPQTYANHMRFDPAFHFFLVPVMGLAWVLSIIHLVRVPVMTSVWMLLISTVVLVGLFKMRMYSLKVQDRVIRLEERYRLHLLLPEAHRLHIERLTEAQLIALRFASDDELPGLVDRSVADNLKTADIKKTIKTWRPDYWRV